MPATARAAPSPHPSRAARRPRLELVAPAPPPSTAHADTLTIERARGLRIDARAGVLVDGKRGTLRIEPRRARFVARLHRAWPWPVPTCDLLAEFQPPGAPERDPARQQQAETKRRRKLHKAVAAVREALAPAGLTILSLDPGGSGLPSAMTIGVLLSASGEPAPR